MDMDTPSASTPEVAVLNPGTSARLRALYLSYRQAEQRFNDAVSLVRSVMELPDTAMPQEDFRAFVLRPDAKETAPPGAE